MNSYLIKFSSPLTAEQVEGILAEWGRVEVNEAPKAPTPTASPFPPVPAGMEIRHVGRWGGKPPQWLAEEDKLFVLVPSGYEDFNVHFGSAGDNYWFADVRRDVRVPCGFFPDPQEAQALVQDYLDNPGYYIF